MMRAALLAFDELVALDADQRAQRLAHLSTTDPELYQIVEQLLAADQQADQRLAGLESSLRSFVNNNSDPLQLVGRTIAHFHIIGPLAAGGMGIVYRAEDTH